MSVWFHYRRESRLKEDFERGHLMRHNRFIFLNNGTEALPEAAYESAIWGLHCPEPLICKTAFKDITKPWSLKTIQQQAAQGERLFLLEIHVQPDDKIFVSDTSVFKELREIEPRDTITTEDIKKLEAPYYESYWNSIIPFSDYRTGQYEEPEVVCFSDIGFSKARIKIKKETKEFISKMPDVDIFELMGLDHP